MLERRGIPHHVLNAKQHAREAADRRPGRAAARASRWPPTWPAAASTSCSAATPRGWPPRRSGRRASTRTPTRARPRYHELHAKYEEECAAEGDKIRELGGLYVLGSERHESRRIDNQLRGRSGRQGDPGESRFFLSLEDELMRLFATGAMNWVMGRALPEDVPDRRQDGDQGHRAGPEHRRGPQRRDPQGRPQVRRGHERAAQGDLRPPAADHRRRGPARPTPRSCSSAIASIVKAAARATSSRSGTSTACDRDPPYYPTQFAADDLAEARRRRRRSTRAWWPRPSSTTSSASRRCLPRGGEETDTMRPSSAR